MGRNNLGYGALTNVDAGQVEHSLDLLKSTFPDKHINILEIGVYEGITSLAIKRKLEAIGITDYTYYGIDNERNKKVPIPFKGYELIIGDSVEVFDQLPELHWVFIDGCHCVNHVMLDFLHYGNKIVSGGLLLFHDTSPVCQGKQYQGHGPQNSHFGISVLEAFNKLDIFKRTDWRHIGEGYDAKVGTWGGTTIFQKIDAGDYRARDGQDKWVINILGRKRNGYFVDIGASDGTTSNNTYVLEKELGWKGICVEANPGERAFQSLIKNRKCACENVCIYSENTTVDFVARGRKVEGSGIFADFAHHSIKKLVEKNHPVVQMPSITLLKLLEKNNAPVVIDYLSVDTEGAEWEILKSFDFKKHVFLTITVENNYREKEPIEEYRVKRDNIRNLLRCYGYILKKQLSDGEDWFIHKSVAKEVGEIDYSLSYLLDCFPMNYFDYLVDIGGHVGKISTLFSEQHPKSKIICLEPSKKQFDIIARNIKPFKNINLLQSALGNGQKLYIQEHSAVIGGQDCFLERDTGGYKVQSKTLSEIFSENKIDTNKKVCLKIDCEGGERFLLNDKKAIEIIKSCTHVGLEIHFKHEANKYTAWFNDENYPSFSEYSDWINNFKDTHNILYHNSNKHKGLGCYVLTKKEEVQLI